MLGDLFYFILFYLMFAIPECLTHIWVYNVTVKHTKLHEVFTYLGQYVLTLTESSSGPSKIQILNYNV